MLKKKCAMGGLIITTAAGALLTCQPAFAQAPAWGGWGGGWRTTRTFQGHRSWNANWNALFNRIHLRVRNRNNNIAIARNDQAQAERQRQLQTEPREADAAERQIRLVTTCRPTDRDINRGFTCS